MAQKEAEASGSRLFFLSVSLPFVFLPRGQAAADVALGFVEVQDGLYLLVQCVIHALQALAEVLVDGAFGYAEVFGGGADGGAGVYDVVGQLDGPVLDV